MQERNFAFERTKTRVFNEHGDRIEEREEFRENPATSASDRLEGSRLPEGSVRRYAYKYDSHGANLVLQDMLNSKDISPEVLSKADCVLIVPDVKKFGFGVGGSGGPWRHRGQRV